MLSSLGPDDRFNLARCDVDCQWVFNEPIGPEAENVAKATEVLADRASLGSLVSLRCEAHQEEAGAGRFLCTARTLKDKRRGPGWTYTEVRRGPAGLR